ncbi:MAG: hypothetical protein NC416_05045 [Eubacterium sp.]|nr:hypothetical protein [Eubacterium sp.]
MYNFTVMHQNEAVARVQISDDRKDVKINKIIPDSIFQPFGGGDLSPEAMVMVSGSSIGTQKKYYDRGYWYKQNRTGYEGRAEYLASKVLSCSDIDEYVEYECCKINGADGCRSFNFLKDDESYISLQRLYDIYHGGQLSERVRLYDNVSERIEFVTEFVVNTIGIDLRPYLSKLLTFDMLILNVDRHFNNLGIVVNGKKQIYRPAPVFDNGNSLLSDMNRYDYNDSLEENISKVIGQPFCANLEYQAMEIGPSLKINYQKLFKELSREPDSRALEVLHFQLKKYENILRDDTLMKGFH